MRSGGGRAQAKTGLGGHGDTGKKREEEEGNEEEEGGRERRTPSHENEGGGSQLAEGGD